MAKPVPCGEEENDEEEDSESESALAAAAPARNLLGGDFEVDSASAAASSALPKARLAARGRTLGVQAPARVSEDRSRSARGVRAPDVGKTSTAAEEALERAAALLRNFGDAQQPSDINEVSLSSAIAQAKHVIGQLQRSGQWETLDKIQAAEASLKAAAACGHALKGFTVGRNAHTDAAARMLTTAYEKLGTLSPPLRAPVPIRYQVLIAMDLQKRLQLEDWIGSADSISAKSLAGGFEGSWYATL